MGSGVEFRSSEMETNGGFEKPQEECGIVGVYDPAGNTAPMVYEGLKSLQHRGQDGAGISYLDIDAGNHAPRIEVIKGLGRVRQVFDEGQRIADLINSPLASGHVRYATSSTPEDALAATQPLDGAQEAGGVINFSNAHNGNFEEGTIRQLAREQGVAYAGTDTMVFTRLLERAVQIHGHMDVALHDLLPRLAGAFCLNILTPDALYAVKDRHDIRPLAHGTAGDTIMVASEMNSLATIGISEGEEQEVRPGTLLIIDKDGVREERWADPDPKPCIFEHIYLSKPNNMHSGLRGRDLRLRAGAELARIAPVAADMVVPVLGSAKYYAHGYANVSGIAYNENALLKNPTRRNADSDRTFIAATQDARERAVRDKFIVNPSEVEGKDVILVDDSLVRGTTMQVLIRLCREMGARNVHVRIPSPQYVNPCHLGVNVQSREELLAHNRTIEDMRRELGADSLAFLELEEFRKIVGPLGKRACMGCLGGAYATASPSQQLLAA